MKNLRCFLYVTAGAGYNKEHSSQQVSRTETWYKKRWEVYVELIKDNAVYNKAKEN